MPDATLARAAEATLNGGFSGDVLLPGADGYDDARAVFNAMIDRRPALIACCETTTDVAAAVRFARAQDLPIAIRGGAHAVSGHAVCDDGLVVDLRRMSAVSVDAGARTARVQGGCTWGDVDGETQKSGLAVTGGRVPGTGVGGLVLGGGSGWLERKFGYTCDNLLSVELVTASGEVVRASADERPELFWALRGGGGNFGVVTEFEFRLHEVGPTIAGGILMFPVERGVELMKAYRDYMLQAPDEVGGAAAVLCAPPEDFVPEPVRGKPVFGVIFTYSGSVEDGEREAAKLREWGPAVDMVAPMPYADGGQRLIEAGNPPGMQHYWKAGFIRELSDEAIETFVSHAADVCSPMTANIMVPLGGAVARVGEDETVLGMRDAMWNYHVLAQWPDPADGERNIAWTRAFDQAMQPYALDGLYINFVAEPPEDVLESSFGAEKVARLRAVKAEYDPDNVFRFNQNIKPGVSPGA